MSSRTLLIIVSTNDGRWLAPCLESLAASRLDGVDVLVVLNACTDESAEVLRKAAIRADVVRIGEKVGFAAANNIGIAHACASSYDYVFLLNPDTKVHPDAIAAATSFLDSNPSYAIVGSRQIDYDAKGWENPNEWTRLVLDEAAAMGNHPKESGAMSSVDHYWVQGAAMMFRTSLVRRIGLLDPVYGTFYEETDFCRRCGLSGRKVAILLDSRIKHFEGGNWRRSRRDRARRDFLYLRNQFVYFVSGAPTWWEGLRLAGPLLAGQIRSVAVGAEHTTLGLWRYSAVLAAILARLPSIWRMRSRNRRICARETLRAHELAIGSNGRQVQVTWLRGGLELSA